MNLCYKNRLRADYPALLSDTAAGLQTQFDVIAVLFEMLIVNEMKTKVMVFGNNMNSD